MKIKYSPELKDAIDKCSREIIDMIGPILEKYLKDSPDETVPHCLGVVSVNIARHALKNLKNADEQIEWIATFLHHCEKIVPDRIKNIEFDEDGEVDDDQESVTIQ